MSNERKKIHLLNNLPHIYELEDMMEFCQKHEKLYIWGNGESEQYLLKYFDMIKVEIAGFVVAKEEERNKDYSDVYRRVPVKLFDEIEDITTVGMIIGSSEKWYHRIIPFLR